MEKQLQNLIDTIEVLKIKKGDAVIVKCEDKLAQSVYARITKTLKDVLMRMGKPDIPVIILDNGVEIEILRLKEGK